MKTCLVVDDSSVIRKIASLGVTIIVIEHLMKVVLSISHRLVVLHHGQLIAQGAPREVVGDRHALYYGYEIDDATLVPGDCARIYTTRFDEWMKRPAPPRPAPAPERTSAR